MRPEVVEEPHRSIPRMKPPCYTFCRSRDDLDARGLRVDGQRDNTGTFLPGLAWRLAWLAQAQATAEKSQGLQLEPLLQSSS